MTIDRLRIENFQRHELLDLRLDAGITTLVGASDMGKSSVIRALRWLALNRPAGDGFMRVGTPKGGRMSVKARCKGRVTVRRERGGGENAYLVGADVYRAFGQDVPPEVTKALNLGPDNFAGQHDPPFWLSLTPGELARELNRIADLDCIDRVESRLGARLRALRAEAGVLATRAAEAGRAVAASVGAVAADQDLTQIEGVDEKSREVEAKADRLAKVTGYLFTAEAEAGRAVPDLSGLEVLRGRAVEANNRANGLVLLAEEVRLSSARVDALRIWAEDADARLAKELGGRCPLCGGVLS